MPWSVKDGEIVEDASAEYLYNGGYRKPCDACGSSHTNYFTLGVDEGTGMWAWVCHDCGNLTPPFQEFPYYPD